MKLLSGNPWEAKLLTYGKEVNDERSEPEGILDDLPYLAMVRHGRPLEGFGKISPLSQICVQINGGDTRGILVATRLSRN